MTKKTLLMTLITGAFIVSGCAKKSEDVPLTPPTAQSEGIGPFTIEFSTANAYEKKVNVPIAQSEGKLEFLAYSEVPYQITVADYKMQVLGCDASKVQFNLYWVPDVNQVPTSGYAIQKSSWVQVQSKIKSSILAVFKNLEGCTHINFEIYLTKNL